MRTPGAEIGSSGTAIDKQQSADQVVRSAQGEQTSWLGAHWPKLTALLLWGLLIGGYYWYTSSRNLGPVAAMRQLITLMQNSAYGPLIYIAVYALRPLLFFSSALITLAGGFIFGPLWGIVHTVVAANISAMVAYVIGRYFGKGILDTEKSSGVIQRYATRMRENSFETVLIMRFLYLPYDLVNYLGGLLHIDWKAFLLATVLGSIPATISFVLAGASFDGTFEGGVPKLNPWVFGASIVLFVVSLGLARYVKRRERRQQTNENPMA